MYRIVLLFLLSSVFTSCQTDSTLFDEVSELAQFNPSFNPILIQSGAEDESNSMMKYGVFQLDSSEFERLEKSIYENDEFGEGSFYLNFDLNDYIQDRNLIILNMSRSSISENRYAAVYYVYLFSDGKTFAVCEVKS